MAKLFKEVPAATGGGKEEYHPTLQGYLDKHPSAGGFATIGNAAKGTSDGGAQTDLARAVKRRGRK
jgi:hypothetical protein